MAVRDWLEEGELRRAFECVALGVSVHEPSGAIVYVNRVGLDLIGWSTARDVSLEEFRERLQVLGEAGAPAALDDLPVSRALAGQEAVDAEISVRLPTGLRRQLRVLCRRMSDGRGALEAVIATFYDFGETVNARGVVRDLVEQSTPVLSVGNRLLLQPLIGTLDSQRAAQAMERLLETVGNTGARVAIVDITGVSAVDTATANHLLRSLNAARLLGCEVVLSGVSPPIARTITLLGLDLSALRTKRDVAAAIEFGRRWVEATETLPARDGAELLVDESPGDPLPGTE